jgi:hypothetical protein
MRVEQALLMLAAFICVAMVNRSLAPLRSKPMELLEHLSLGVLALTITLSLYFVDTTLDTTVQVRDRVETQCALIEHNL